MNPQELDRLIASLTDDELQQIRDYRPSKAELDPATQNADPLRGANRQFVKSLLGGGDD